MPCGLKMTMSQPYLWVRGFGSVNIECTQLSEAEAQEKRGADNNQEYFLMMLHIALASHFGEKSKLLFWNGHTDYMCENGKIWIKEKCL